MTSRKIYRKFYFFKHKILRNKSAEKKRHSYFQLKTNKQNSIIYLGSVSICSLAASMWFHFLTNFKYEAYNMQMHYIVFFLQQIKTGNYKWTIFLSIRSNLYLEDSTCSLSCLYSVRWQLKHVCDAPPCCRSSVNLSHQLAYYTHSGSKCLKSTGNKFTCIYFKNFSTNSYRFRFRWLHMLHVQNLSNCCRQLISHFMNLIFGGFLLFGLTVYKAYKLTWMSAPSLSKQLVRTGWSKPKRNLS